MITSKITGKGQVTIPKKIRETLLVGEGDYIWYEIQEAAVTIRKIPKADLEWARAINGTLSEWDDELDDEI